MILFDHQDHQMQGENMISEKVIVEVRKHFNEEQSNAILRISLSGNEIPRRQK